jgi:hypothetical protein
MMTIAYISISKFKTEMDKESLDQKLHFYFELGYELISVTPVKTHVNHWAITGQQIFVEDLLYHLVKNEK